MFRRQPLTFVTFDRSKTSGLSSERHSSSSNRLPSAAAVTSLQVRVQSSIGSSSKRFTKASVKKTAECPTTTTVPADHDDVDDGEVLADTARSETGSGKLDTIKRHNKPDTLTARKPKGSLGSEGVRVMISGFPMAIEEAAIHKRTVKSYGEVLRIKTWKSEELEKHAVFIDFPNKAIAHKAIADAATTMPVSYGLVEGSLRATVARDQPCEKISDKLVDPYTVRISDLPVDFDLCGLSAMLEEKVGPVVKRSLRRAETYSMATITFGSSYEALLAQELHSPTVNGVSITIRRQYVYKSSKKKKQGEGTGGKKLQPGLSELHEILIYRIPKSVMEQGNPAELLNLCKSWGTVVAIRLRRDGNGGLFAIAEYSTLAEASTAIRALRAGATLGGQTMGAERARADPKKQVEQPNTRTILLQGDPLSSDLNISKQRIRQHFEKLGTVTHVHMATSPTGHSIAFVTFETTRMASFAIGLVWQIDGRPILCRWGTRENGTNRQAVGASVVENDPDLVEMEMRRMNMKAPWPVGLSLHERASDGVVVPEHYTAYRFPSGANKDDIPSCLTVVEKGGERESELASASLRRQSNIEIAKAALVSADGVKDFFSKHVITKVQFFRVTAKILVRVRA